MNRKTFLAALGLSLVLAAPGAAAEPFSTGFGVGEGIPAFSAKQTVVLYAAPSTRSKKTGEAIRKGTHFRAAETRFITTSTGSYKVLVPITIKGHSFGAVNFVENDNVASPIKEFNLAAGSRIELLRYRGEGYVMIRIEDEVVEALEPDLRKVSMERAPKNEWWIAVSGKGNKRKGWALIDDKIEVAREYK